MVAASPVVDHQRHAHRRKRSDSTAASSTAGSIIGGFGGGGGGGSRHQSPSANSVASFSSVRSSSALGSGTGTGIGQATPSRPTPRRRRLLCLQPTDKDRKNSRTNRVKDGLEGWDDDASESD